MGSPERRTASYTFVHSTACFARLLVLPSSGGCLGLSPIREQYEHMQSAVILASSALVASIGEKSCTGDRGRSEGSEFAHEIDIVSANILSERMETDRTA